MKHLLPILVIATISAVFAGCTQSNESQTKAVKGDITRLKSPSYRMPEMMVVKAVAEKSTSSSPLAVDTCFVGYVVNADGINSVKELYTSENARRWSPRIFTKTAVSPLAVAAAIDQKTLAEAADLYGQDIHLFRLMTFISPRNLIWAAAGAALDAAQGIAKGINAFEARWSNGEKIVRHVLREDDTHPQHFHKLNPIESMALYLAFEDLNSDQSDETKKGCESPGAVQLSAQ